MLAVEKLIYAIREDLGIKSGGLGEGDLLRIFINDFDQFMADYERRRKEAIGQAA